jgi:hypothetical protein
MAAEFRQRLGPYVQGLTAEFNPAAADDSRDKAYPKRLQEAKKLVRGDHLLDMDLLYHNAIQFYDAVMEFAHGVDAVLRQDPQRSPTSIRGADLYEAMTTMPPFVGMQGKIVLDAYGLKEGHFAMRNVWGKQSLKVLLMDTLHRSISDVTHLNTWVTDLSGTVTWKFQGQPILFMGKAPPLQPPNRSVCPCFFGESLYGPVAWAKQACSTGASQFCGAGNTSVIPKNIFKGHCLPGNFLVRSKLPEDPDSPCPECCEKCKVGFYIEPRCPIAPLACPLPDLCPTYATIPCPMPHRAIISLMPSAQPCCVQRHRHARLDCLRSLQPWILCTVTSFGSVRSVRSRPVLKRYGQLQLHLLRTRDVPDEH